MYFAILFSCDDVIASLLPAMLICFYYQKQMTDSKKKHLCWIVQTISEVKY